MQSQKKVSQHLNVFLANMYTSLSTSSDILIYSTFSLHLFMPN